ncbi:uridine kinase [Microlunatus sp. GCM10028923]|uniref:uridine kinase family protein n=1 Tax=Microlunatus sp. GCM10028923 TaxID=3273400 RepID=UPI003620C4D8
MKLPEGTTEPVITHWQRASTTELLDRLDLPDRTAGNRVILVDGRSAGGKTTLAGRLRSALAGSELVHTDDVAWNHSFFRWDSELIENVIAPVRRNEPVRYRPPGWAGKGREGAIVVEPGRDLIVEGVGAGRASIAAWADAVVWVQSDFTDARVRGIARDLELGIRDAAGVESFWEEWMSSELPFLEVEQPWRLAKIIVAGRATADDPDLVDLALT